MAHPVVTLTTDFGARDGYVGAMKGVVLGISPGVTLIDISHEVPPQDIVHAAFVLRTAYRYFPPDGIHVCVVDPGVGTSRRPLLLETPAGRFVAPDNGVLTYALMDHRALADEGGPGAQAGFMEPRSVPVPDSCSAYVLNREEFWLRPLSNTFHGRDIFAPVAAHLSLGVAAEELGDLVEEAVCLSVPEPEESEGLITGRIIHVDGYGNLVSNIPPGMIVGDPAEVRVGGRRISGLSGSFEGGRELLAIAGSHGYIEIAVENGSAAETLGIGLGARMTVSLGDA